MKENNLYYILILDYLRNFENRVFFIKKMFLFSYQHRTYETDLKALGIRLRLLLFCHMEILLISFDWISKLRRFSSRVLNFLISLENE